MRRPVICEAVCLSSAVFAFFFSMIIADFHFYRFLGSCFLYLLGSAVGALSCYPVDKEPPKGADER